MPGHQVTFRGWTCRVVRGSYGHTERIALSLTDIVSGEPVATATVNLPEIALGPDEVIIKDCSENEGMRDTLILAEVMALCAGAKRHQSAQPGYSASVRRGLRLHLPDLSSAAQARSVEAPWHVAYGACENGHAR